MMTATYSPEDNKLRLYSDARLARATYDRVRAAGFVWAAKQGLFVAPAWTPEREDLLTELCGAIGDEDTSLVERAEERADRFGDYSDMRAEDADRAHAAVERITDGIPLGQPILVGHHSERHACKDAERIENGMRKAVRLWQTARYWTDRAAGAVRHAKYKELPAVRARRIKGLEAEQRKHTRERDRLDRLLTFWRGTPTRDQAIRVCNVGDHGGVILPGGERYWSAWGALTDGTVSVEELTRQRLDALPGLIAYRGRWVAHLDNRLAYERTMMAESGGTAADRVRPETGGACRCWASPGHGRGWSYIRKLNRVSVTVEDNWGHGGPNFTRTIPFDKLTAVMSAAEVDAKRAAGLVVESSGRLGFYLLDVPPPATREQSDLDERGAKFEAMAGSLREGVKVVSAPQLFPTPPEIARRVVALAEIRPGMAVLEPSAGTGNLVKAIREGCPDAEIHAVEINREVALVLARCLGYPNPPTPGFTATHGDFLSIAGELGTFDRIVMNPPFSHGEDIRHVEHALTMLKPGGRLVAICANGPRQRERLEPPASAWIDLPAGSFQEQGTSVNAAIVVIDG